MPVAARPASQTLSSMLCSSTATATAEAISNQIRQNRSARMCATGWARMRFRALPRLVRSASSASCRGRKLNAASAAVRSAAMLRNTSAMPARSRGVTGWSRRVLLCR